MRSRSFVVATLFSCIAWGCGLSTRVPPPTAADTILVNGNILTLDSLFSVAEALAVRDGRVLAVGSTEEIGALAGEDTQRIDLGGRTVVPGLADNHFHTIGGGPGVDLSRVRRMDDLLAAVAERVAQSEPGAIVITNSNWHEAQLHEQRLPLRRDLDTVAPDNPVVVVRGGHEYVLNSAALARWGITAETPVPEGGRITRYDDGELNGELVDTAKRLVSLPFPPEKDFDTRLREQVDEYATLHAAGVTSVRHPGISVEQYRVLQEIQRRGQLTMRVNVLLRLGGRSASEVAAALDASNVRPGEGGDWLRVGGIKLGVDGGFEGGWMTEAYAEPWGENGTFFGLQTMAAAQYTDIVRELARRGWRVATHAVGDAAIDLVLDAYEAANEVRPITGQRWAIEHGFVPRADQFERMRRLNLVVSAQNHLYVAGPSLVDYWGRERAEWVTPVRAYTDNGVSVSLGTDSPVIPYPPLWVLYHFITRDTITGGVFGADQRITRQAALSLMTLGYAHLTLDDPLKGSLEPDTLADLVVLSEDIMTSNPEAIRDAAVLLTMVGGRIVHCAASL